MTISQHGLLRFCGVVSGRSTSVRRSTRVTSFYASILYSRVTERTYTRYAYRIPNSADDLGLMTNAPMSLTSARDKHLGLSNVLTCSRSTNFQVSNHGRLLPKLL